MKELKRISGCLFAVLGIVWASLLLTGCQTPPVFADFPSTTTVAGTTNKPGYTRPVRGGSDDFRVGDVVTITFSSAGGESVLQTQQEAIKDDGRINPPLIGSVVALGKSPGELQAELQEKYNKYYRNTTVTVIPKDRYYYVLGEVKAPGPKTYLGETDIIKAISSAGDFTDFANKRKVQLIRSNNKTEIIDVKKAIQGSQYDVPVYPGDKVVVPRSMF